MSALKYDARGCAFEIESNTPGTYVAIGGINTFSKSRNSANTDTTTYASAGDYEQQIMQRGKTLPRAVNTAVVSWLLVGPLLQRIHDAVGARPEGSRTFAFRMVPMLDKRAHGREIVTDQLESEGHAMTRRRIGAGDIHLQFWERITHDLPAPLFDAGKEAHRPKMRIQRLLRRRYSVSHC